MTRTPVTVERCLRSDSSADAALAWNNLHWLQRFEPGNANG